MNFFKMELMGIPHLNITNPPFPDSSEVAPPFLMTRKREKLNKYSNMTLTSIPHLNLERGDL
jgi:hypothetical protein